MNSLIDKFFIIIDIIFHLLPVSKKRVLFSSFRGQYNDNPKYISIKLHELDPTIIQYWVISEKSKANDLPDYIHVVRYNTLKYCWIKNRCCIIVENGAGNYIFNSFRKVTIKRLLKNRKQFDISTWHGNPIKHIGAQIPENNDWNSTSFNTTSDLLICGCDFVKNVFSQAFFNKMPIVLMGTPRTDILFNISVEEKNTIRSKLRLPINKKIVLYAPTYRNNPDDSGIKQMRQMNFDRLFNSLSKRFGGEWVFVFRVHNMVLLKLDISKITSDYCDQIINGNCFDDMMEYMAVSDVLITDYSGCIFDNALTDIPCFLFAHDRINYQEVERGTYISIDKLPYSFANTFDELISNILKYDDDINRINVNRFLKLIGNIEDGNASERVCKLLFQKIEDM